MVRCNHHHEPHGVQDKSVLTSQLFVEGIEKGSRYKYPPGVQVVKDHEVTSENAENIQPMPQSIQEAGGHDDKASQSST